MEITIEITEDEVINFGDEHNRPVSLKQATIGLEKIKEIATNKLYKLKEEMIGQALNKARFSK